MTDLPLPNELVEWIVDYTIENENDLRPLCDLSLVSRQWHAVLQARIYSRWFYDGKHHSISSLWKFLRTVLCNGRIADSVRSLSIWNWTLDLVHKRDRLLLSKNDLDLIRSAIHDVGLTSIESQFIESVKKSDPRPLMALLLASLRNLNILNAELPEKDMFLAELLRIAIDRQGQTAQPLRNLSEAHLMSTYNYCGAVHAHYTYYLRLDHLWPMFRLPSITKLSLFDLEPEGASGYLGSTTKISGMTDLTLVHDEECLLSMADTMTLLRLPKALRKLSIYLGDRKSKDDSYQFSNADLWRAIVEHKGSIRHLDIYRDYDRWIPPLHNPDKSHFGSLRDFQCLEHLCIQPEVLLRACCSEEVARVGLEEVLPPTLQSLTLYGHKELAKNKTVEMQLRDIVTGEGFPFLDRIILEKSPLSYGVVNPFVDPADPPYGVLKQVCEEHGIEFQTIRAPSHRKGEHGHYRFQPVLDRRMEMCELDETESVLHKHLTRLGRPNGYVGFNEGRLRIILDSLDTFELPWDELTRNALHPESSRKSNPAGDSSETVDSESDDSSSAG